MLRVQKVFCWLPVWEVDEDAFDGILVMQYTASDVKKGCKDGCGTAVTVTVSWCNRVQSGMHEGVRSQSFC